MGHVILVMECGYINSSVHILRPLTRPNILSEISGVLHKQLTIVGGNANTSRVPPVEDVQLRNPLLFPSSDFSDYCWVWNFYRFITYCRFHFCCCLVVCKSEARCLEWSSYVILTLLCCARSQDFTITSRRDRYLGLSIETRPHCTLPISFLSDEVLTCFRGLWREFYTCLLPEWRTREGQRLGYQILLSFGWKLQFECIGFGND